jgi:hypothetical protein
VGAVEDARKSKLSPWNVHLQIQEEAMASKAKLAAKAGGKAQMPCVSLLVPEEEALGNLEQQALIV